MMQIKPISWHGEDCGVYKNCAAFFKVKEAFGGLSNMAGGYALKINGESIYSSEALYQACRFPHHPDWQQEIIEQKSPMAAKMKAKKDKLRPDSRSDWGEIQIDVMRWVLRVKLAQNYSSFSDLLLSTGDRAIVEKSRKDKFWGAVEDVEGNLHGSNQLGRLLMELRELVKTQSPQDLTVVQPLEIPDFLLLGNPITTVRGVVFKSR